MKWSVRWLLAGLLLALAPVVPADARQANAPVDPRLLALDIGAFPAGAVITDLRVDRTAAAVAKEGFFGGTYPTTQGLLYQQWHFEGSLVERAHLPPFQGVRREVWLLATLFPTRAGAIAAYTSDATGLNCRTVAIVALPLRSTTCPYINRQTAQAGLYVMATAGNVEFIVLGWVAAASVAARDRGLRDASYVAQHEAGHVTHLLALGRLGARPPAPSRQALKRYTNARAHYSISYPASWTVLPASNEDLSVRAPDGNAFLAAGAYAGQPVTVAQIKQQQQKVLAGLHVPPQAIGYAARRINGVIFQLAEGVAKGSATRHDLDVIALDAYDHGYLYDFGAGVLLNEPNTAAETRLLQASLNSIRLP